MILCKMATAALALCNPLCFLFCKYDRLPLKVLKSALIDFYDPAAISNAKHQLLEDMRNANFTEKLPHVPERRAGEMRAVNEVDDIFVLISFMDERKLLDVLPVYVSDNPDNMPSSRLFEGDMKMFMTLLEKISDKLTSHGSAIAAIVNDLHKLQSKPVDLGNSASVHRPWMQQGVNNNTASLPSRSVDDVGPSALGNPARAKPIVNKPSTSWAAIAARSTPSHPRNQTNSTTATDDDLSNNEFIDHHSRRYKRNKRRMENSFSPVKTDQQQQQQRKATDSTQPRRRAAVLGRSTGSVSGIAAANSVPVKAVYCIDNIDVSYNVDDIVGFVNSQGITVLSCFEVNPRKMRSDIYTNQRKAFRLCINYDHRNKLLDPSRWPDSVVVSDWFFKPQHKELRSREAPVDKRQRTEIPHRPHSSENVGSDIEHSDDVTVIAPDAIVGADVHPEADVDMDATIFTQENTSTADRSSSVTPSNKMLN